jgi:hypothetical protein
VFAAAALVFAVVVVFGGSPDRSPEGDVATIPDLAAPPTTGDGPSITPDGTGDLVGYPTKPAGWRQLDAGPLVSRMGAAVVWADRQLLVWGGRDLTNGFTSGAMFSPSATGEPAWRTMPRPDVAGGEVTASVWTGRTLLVATDAVAVLDPIGLGWTTGNPPIPIEPFTAAWTGSEVIVVGRSPGDGPSTTVALAYGAEGSCCRVLPPPPIVLDHGTAAWNGSRVVLIGGRRDGTERAVLATYDPDSDTWDTHGDTPLQGGPGLTAVWSGGSLVAIDADLAGGRWNEAAGWRTMKDPPFELVGCFTRMAVVGNEVFVWHCRQAAVYDPASGRWTSISTPVLPSHTISTSCVPEATGTTVYLWCGNGDGATPLFYAADLGRVESSRVPDDTRRSRRPRSVGITSVPFLRRR